MELQQVPGSSTASAVTPPGPPLAVAENSSAADSSATHSSAADPSAADEDDMPADIEHMLGKWFSIDCPPSSIAENSVPHSSSQNSRVPGLTRRFVGVVASNCWRSKSILLSPVHEVVLQPDGQNVLVAMPSLVLPASVLKAATPQSNFAHHHHSQDTSVSTSAGAAAHLPVHAFGVPHPGFHAQQHAGGYAPPPFPAPAAVGTHAPFGQALHPHGVRPGPAGRLSLPGVAAGAGVPTFICHPHPRHHQARQHPHAQRPAVPHGWVPAAGAAAAGEGMPPPPAPMTAAAAAAHPPAFPHHHEAHHGGPMHVMHPAGPAAASHCSPSPYHLAGPGSTPSAPSPHHSAGLGLQQHPFQQQVQAQVQQGVMVMAPYPHPHSHSHAPTPMYHIPPGTSAAGAPPQPPMPHMHAQGHHPHPHAMQMGVLAPMPQQQHQQYMPPASHSHQPPPPPPPPAAANMQHAPPPMPMHAPHMQQQHQGAPPPPHAVMVHQQQFGMPEPAHPHRVQQGQGQGAAAAAQPPPPPPPPPKASAAAVPVPVPASGQATEFSGKATAQPTVAAGGKASSSRPASGAGAAPASVPAPAGSGDEASVSVSAASSATQMQRQQAAAAVAAASAGGNLSTGEMNTLLAPLDRFVAEALRQRRAGAMDDAAWGTAVAAALRALYALRLPPRATLHVLAVWERGGLLTPQQHRLQLQQLHRYLHNLSVTLGLNPAGLPGAPLSTAAARSGTTTPTNSVSTPNASAALAAAAVGFAAAMDAAAEEAQGLVASMPRPLSQPQQQQQLVVPELEGPAQEPTPAAAAAAGSQAPADGQGWAKASKQPTAAATGGAGAGAGGIMTNVTNRLPPAAGRPGSHKPPHGPKQQLQYDAVHAAHSQQVVALGYVSHPPPAAQPQQPQQRPSAPSHAQQFMPPQSVVQQLQGKGQRGKGGSNGGSARSSTAPSRTASLGSATVLPSVPSSQQQQQLQSRGSSGGSNTAGAAAAGGGAAGQLPPAGPSASASERAARGGSSGGSAVASRRTSSSGGAAGQSCAYAVHVHGAYGVPPQPQPLQPTCASEAQDAALVLPACASVQFLDVRAASTQPLMPQQQQQQGAAGSSEVTWASCGLPLGITAALQDCGLTHPSPTHASIVSAITRADALHAPADAPAVAALAHAAGCTAVPPAPASCRVVSLLMDPGPSETAAMAAGVIALRQAMQAAYDCAVADAAAPAAAAAAGGGEHPVVRALVLCPTRAEAEVMRDLTSALGRNAGVRAEVCAPASSTSCGGAPPAPQQQQQQQEEAASLMRAHLLLGTPGRMLEMMRSGALSLATGPRLVLLCQSSVLLGAEFRRQVGELLSLLLLPVHTACAARASGGGADDVEALMASLASAPASAPGSGSGAHAAYAPSAFAASLAPCGSSSYAPSCFGGALSESEAAAAVGGCGSVLLALAPTPLHVTAHKQLRRWAALVAGGSGITPLAGAGVSGLSSCRRSEAGSELSSCPSLCPSLCLTVSSSLPSMTAAGAAAVAAAVGDACDAAQQQGQVQGGGCGLKRASSCGSAGSALRPEAHPFVPVVAAPGAACLQ